MLASLCATIIFKERRAVLSWRKASFIKMSWLALQLWRATTGKLRGSLC
jgi:hypothetical protein